jgi:hypothetical protein
MVEPPCGLKREDRLVMGKNFLSPLRVGSPSNTDLLLSCARGYYKFDDLVKSRKTPFFVIPVDPRSGPGQAPESSGFLDAGSNPA